MIKKKESRRGGGGGEANKEKNVESEFSKGQQPRLGGISEGVFEKSLSERGETANFLKRIPKKGTRKESFAMKGKVPTFSPRQFVENKLLGLLGNI